MSVQVVTTICCPPARLSWRSLAMALIAFALTASGPALAQRQEGYRGPGVPATELISCASRDSRVTHCPTPPGRVHLRRQVSGSPCIEGQTWGSGRNGIWVSSGCRGEFVVEGRRHGGNRPGHFAPPPWSGAPGLDAGFSHQIRCESQQGRRHSCSIPNAHRVRLLQQHSDAVCIEGQTWGWARHEVWVTGGCRATFEAR